MATMMMRTTQRLMSSIKSTGMQNTTMRALMNGAMTTVQTTTPVSKNGGESFKNFSQQTTTRWLQSLRPPTPLSTRDEEQQSPKTGLKNKLMLGALPMMPMVGMAASATEFEPLLGPTSVWLLSSCIPIGTVSLGLPGLAAQSFFLSPIPVMKDILKNKSVGSLPLMPYSSMCASGFLWIAYGLVLDLPAIWLPNVPAFILGAVYTGIFFKHCPPTADWLPGTKNLHAALVLTSIGTVTAISTMMETGAAANALGWLGTGIVIAMFGGPLVAIKTVVKEKSTRALPFAMTVATFVNCSLWTVYGTCVISDFFIWFPNGLGLLSSIVQFGLFAKYGFAKKEE